MSGWRLDAKGEQFISISDKGTWFTGRLVYKGREMTGLADVEAAPMLGADGSSPMQLAAYQRSFAKDDKTARPRAGGAGRVDTEALLTPGQRHA